MEINFFGPNVKALISERSDGSMRLHGHTDYDREASARRRAYCLAHKVNPDRLISGELVHGAHVEVVSKPSNSNLIWSDFRLRATDGLITADPGVFLSVTAADCPTIYFYDPVQRVIGIAHAGWKGVVAGIVPKMIYSLQVGFNCKPEDVLVYIGPGIGLCHFEVGPEVTKQLYPNEPPTRCFADLSKIIFHHLISIGVKKINAYSGCTYCTAPLMTPGSEQWFSARRDKFDPLQSQMVIIGMIK